MTGTVCLDYARTLKIWRERYDAAVAEGRLPAGFDQAFHDLWRYYLMYCEGGFRGGGIDVAQVTLAKRERASGADFEPVAGLEVGFQHLHHRVRHHARRTEKRRVGK